MSPVHYRVVATLPDAASAERYQAWLTGGHVAEVCRLGQASASVVRLSGDGHRFASTYRFESQQDLDRYEREFAPRLRAEGVALFPPESGIRFEREYGQILASFTPQG